jgi:Arginase family
MPYLPRTPASGGLLARPGLKCLMPSSQSRRSAGRQGVRAWSCPRSPRAFTVVLIGQEPGVRAVLADDRGSRSRGRNWPVRRGAHRYARPVSRVSIVGVPSSAASYAADQDLAPAALRSAGLPAKLIAAGLEVHDEGNLPVQVWKPDREHPLAQNAAQAARSLRQLAGSGRCWRGDFALVLGGNCTTALGVMAALRRLEAGVPGLLYVDRHFMHCPRFV